MRSNGSIGKTSRSRDALLNGADVVHLRSSEGVSLQQGGRRSGYTTTDRIVFIRHAEKLEVDVAIGLEDDGTADPESLTVRGWQRAGGVSRGFHLDVLRVQCRGRGEHDEKRNTIRHGHANPSVEVNSLQPRGGLHRRAK